MIVQSCAALHWLSTESWIFSTKSYCYKCDLAILESTNSKVNAVEHRVLLNLLRQGFNQASLRCTGSYVKRYDLSCAGFGWDGSSAASGSCALGEDGAECRSRALKYVFSLSFANLWYQIWYKLGNVKSLRVNLWARSSARKRTGVAGLVIGHPKKLCKRAHNLDGSLLTSSWWIVCHRKDSSNKAAYPSSQQEGRPRESFSQWLPWSGLVHFLVEEDILSLNQLYLAKQSAHSSERHS